MRAAFRETLDTRSLALLVGEDEHECFLPQIDLSPTEVAGDLRDKYTQWPWSAGLLRKRFYPQPSSAKIRTPLMSWYVRRGKNMLKHGKLLPKERGDAISS